MTPDASLVAKFVETFVALDDRRVSQAFDIDGDVTSVLAALHNALSPAGYLQFAKGPDVDYDPVCFDLGKRLRDGDCRIVKFDHEEILCNHRLVEVTELAPSFRRLIEVVIEDATLKRQLADG